jgi:hypothetical protein
MFRTLKREDSMSRSKESRLAALGGGALLAIAMITGGIATASAAPSHTIDVLDACQVFTGYCNGVGTGQCILVGRGTGWVCPGTTESVEFSSLR